MESVLIIKSLLFDVLYLFKVIIRNYRDIALLHSRNLYNSLLELLLDDVQDNMIEDIEIELIKKLQLSSLDALEIEIETQKNLKVDRGVLLLREAKY